MTSEEHGAQDSDVDRAPQEADLETRQGAQGLLDGMQERVEHVPVCRIDEVTQEQGSKKQGCAVTALGRTPSLAAPPGIGPCLQRGCHPARIVKSRFRPSKSGVESSNQTVRAFPFISWSVPGGPEAGSCRPR